MKINVYVLRNKWNFEYFQIFLILILENISDQYYYLEICLFSMTLSANYNFNKIIQFMIIWLLIINMIAYNKNDCL